MTETEGKVMGCQNCGRFANCHQGRSGAMLCGTCIRDPRINRPVQKRPGMPVPM